MLAKQISSLIYKLSGKKTEKPISLKFKMELNENAAMHIANQEILILNDQCTWSSKNTAWYSHLQNIN